MKLKLIRDNEVVVSKAEYELLRQRHSRIKDLLYSIYSGNVSYYVDDSFFPIVKMTNNEVSLPIKWFAYNDHEYNRVCAEELCELLNQKQ